MSLSSRLLRIYIYYIASDGEEEEEKGTAVTSSVNSLRIGGVSACDKKRGRRMVSADVDRKSRSGNLTSYLMSPSRLPAMSV
jgi:hypothetical protein